MTETPTNVTTPPDLTYGYVDGRIILAIGDRSDAARMPDPVPADGMTVTFTPANTILKVTTPTPATVIKQPIVCGVDANGYLIDEQGARGVWLVTGTYKVTYSHPRATIPSHDIEVTTGHTEAAPLDLTTAMPPGGPVPTPSEYAELNGRLAILEATVPGVTDHGALTGLNDDDHALYALADGTRGSFATAAQGALSDTAVQPGDLGTVWLDRYPRLGGESDDSARFTRALADMAADSRLRVLQLGAGTYTLTSSVSVDVDGITVRGAGIRATVISVEADVIGLHFTSCSYPTVESLTVYSSTTARTVFPVVFTDCTHPVVNNAYLDGASGARRSGVHLTGTGGVASMGLVQGSVFNHSCLLVEVDDVKLVDSWVWGMTCDYAVAVRDGSASFVASNVDIVPPFTSTATGIAGIVIGDDGSNPFNAKLMGVYLDGNPTLSTRTGIKIAPGAGGVLIKNTHANQMEAESILVDSAYNVVIEGYTSYANNRAGNGTPEILITQTGAQPVENIRIDNVQFLQTEAVVGTAGPAIKVDSSVSGSQVTVSNFDIKQPSAGGGYSVPEVSVPTSGGYPTVGMSGRGERSVYSAIGSQAVSSGATGATITLASPYPMAYRPRPSQIMLATEGATLPQHRIQYTDDNTIYVAFATAIAAAATIHWRAILCSG